MIDLIINVVWLGVGILGVYPLARAMVHFMAGEFDMEAERFDWCMASLVSCLLMFIWPVVLGFLLVCGSAFMVSKRIWTGNWRLPWKTGARVS